MSPADISCHLSRGVQNITSTSSPWNAGWPDSPEFINQPSSWSVSPNKAIDCVAAHYMDYLNSSTTAKTKLDSAQQREVPDSATNMTAHSHSFKAACH